MTNEERDIQRKLRVLQHAKKIGNAANHADISGLEDPAYIDGETRFKSMAKPVSRLEFKWHLLQPLNELA